MDKSVMVLPNEKIFNIRPFFQKCIHHPEALKKFVFMNDMSISPFVLNDAYETSYQLAEQDFCVLLSDHEESLKNIMIFLPLNISEQQYEFFKNKKEDFKDYNINILSLEENKKFKMYDKTTHTEGLYEQLLNILDQKLIVQNKTKQRIKEEN